MRPEIHSLLTDIKAAARIGHPESLWAALDGLLDLPEVAGNPPMSETFLHRVILPVGQTLAHPRIPPALLKPLAEQPQAALRAAAGVALITRYLTNGQVTLNQLSSLGQDPRKDVRRALILAAKPAEGYHPTQLGILAAAWIEAPSPRKQSTALQLLPYLADRETSTALNLIEGFRVPSDGEVRAAAAAALTGLAEAGWGKEIIELMASWEQSNQAAQWVAGKTLARSWAAEYAAPALAVLAGFAQQAGPGKAFHKAVFALHQHGASETVRQALESWRSSNDPNLQAAAAKVSAKINS